MHYTGFIELDETPLPEELVRLRYIIRISAIGLDVDVAPVWLMGRDACHRRMENRRCSAENRRIETVRRERWSPCRERPRGECLVLRNIFRCFDHLFSSVVITGAWFDEQFAKQIFPHGEWSFFPRTDTRFLAT